MVSNPNRLSMVFSGGLHTNQWTDLTRLARKFGFAKQYAGIIAKPVVKAKQDSPTVRSDALGPFRPADKKTTDISDRKFLSAHSCADQEFDKLVLVVHGVGDPDPGDTLTIFARSLAGEDAPLKDHGEAVWLNEKPDNADHIATFQSHVRRMNYNGQKLEFAEVFWGDCSRVSKGIFGAIYGMFQILFGLRYVAYVAGDQNSLSSEWLQRLGLISSRILHGPVLAITYFLALISGGVLGTQLLWKESYKGPLWTAIVLSIICGVALMTAAIGKRITRSRVVERFWFWVNVTTVFISGLLVVKMMILNAAIPEMNQINAEYPGLVWYCRILVVLLGLLWFIETVVVTGLAGCWLLSFLNPKLYRPALSVAFLLPALAVGIWGQTLPFLWVFAKSRINSIGDVPEFARVFDEAIPLLGVQFILLLIITTAGFVSAIRYFRWRGRLAPDLDGIDSCGPRLIVHPLLQLVIAICTMLGVCLVIYLQFKNYCGECDPRTPFVSLLINANLFAMMMLVPLGVLMFFILPRLRPVLDILLDVVNHFYFRATSLQDALDDDDEFDIKDTTFESGSLFFSHRDKIIGRLKRILAHYRDDSSSHRPELVIVAHSQGTMFAIEALNDPEMAWLCNRFSSTTLVTMGSPLKHLYQHYFGHIYSQLDKPFWSALRKQTDRWINIFRVDDFVGKELDFPDTLCRIEADETEYPSLTFQPRCEYRNFVVGPRGHKSYWTDRAVIRILRRELLQISEDDKGRRAA